MNNEKGELKDLSPQQIELMAGLADRIGDIETIDLVVNLAKQIHEQRLSRGVGGATVRKNPNWTAQDAKLHGARKSVASMERALMQVDKRMAGLERERANLQESLRIAQEHLEKVLEEINGEGEVSTPTEN